MRIKVSAVFLYLALSFQDVCAGGTQSLPAGYDSSATEDPLGQDYEDDSSETDFQIAATLPPEPLPGLYEFILSYIQSEAYRESLRKFLVDDIIVRNLLQRFERSGLSCNRQDFTSWVQLAESDPQALSFSPLLVDRSPVSIGTGNYATASTDTVIDLPILSTDMITSTDHLLSDSVLGKLEFIRERIADSINDMITEELDFTEWMISPNYGGQVSLAMYMLYSEIAQQSTCMNLDSRIFRAVIRQVHYRLVVSAMEDHETFSNFFKPRISVLMDAILRRRRDAIEQLTATTIAPPVEAGPAPATRSGGYAVATVIPILADFDYYCLVACWQCVRRPFTSTSSSTTTTTTTTAAPTAPWESVTTQKNCKKKFIESVQARIADVRMDLTDVTVNEASTYDHSLMDSLELGIFEIANSIIVYGQKSAEISEKIFRIVQSFRIRLHAILHAEMSDELGGIANDQLPRESPHRGAAGARSGSGFRSLRSSEGVSKFHSTDLVASTPLHVMKTSRLQDLIGRTLSELRSLLG